jgi:hypothetical protein
MAEPDRPADTDVGVNPRTSEGEAYPDEEHRTSPRTKCARRTRRSAKRSRARRFPSRSAPARVPSPPVRRRRS